MIVVSRYTRSFLPVRTIPSQPFRQGGSSLKAACHRQAHNRVPQSRCYFSITCPARERWIIQRRLDSFAAWYNTKRPHSALGTRTPEEACRSRAPPKPIVYRTRDRPSIQIEIARYGYHRTTHKSLRSTGHLFNDLLISSRCIGTRQVAATAIERNQTDNGITSRPAAKKKSPITLAACAAMRISDASGRQPTASLKNDGMPLKSL